MPIPTSCVGSGSLVRCFATVNFYYAEVLLFILWFVDRGKFAFFCKPPIPESLNSHVTKIKLKQIKISCSCHLDVFNVLAF